MAISAYSLVQPALAVYDLDAGVDRMHELFGAVPSERNVSREFNNAVYAFANNTYLELLDGAHEGHTRMRFLRQHGPGLYMLCVDLANEDPEEVTAELEQAQVRVVARGQVTANVLAGWHLHPRDAGDILTLIAIKRDSADNTDWAGHKAAAYVSGNIRVVDALKGVIARTADPESEAAAFAKAGLPMERIPGERGMRWTGPTGTILELRPGSAWGHPLIPRKRDYALCWTTQDVDAALERLDRRDLSARRPLPGGRWLSEPDPVLGVRVMLEAAPAA